MLLKLYTIKNKTSFHIFLLISLSLLTCLKAKWSYESFTESNIPIYDGVMYQYQQIKRFESFQGDFSFTNRYSQAVYEFQGNYVSALYNSFITFFFPSFLQNDIDIFLRGLLALIIFTLSIYLFFRNRLGNLRTILIIGIVLQLPFFMHYRVGINTYIPEIPCALLLLSGYFMLLHFYTSLKFRYFFTGLLLMIVPIGIRFNFFAYTFLICIPLFILYIKKWREFDVILKKRTLSFTLLVLILTGSYIFYFIKPFYLYYTETAYAYSTVSNSFISMLKNFWDYFSWEGFLLLAILILSNKTISSKNTNKYNFSVIYPFLIFFSFIILYLKTENVPHINSVMALFFSIIAFSIIPNIKLKINNNLLFLLITLSVGITNYSFILSINKNKNIEQYHVQNSLISFFTGQIRTDKTSTPNYLCFFEGMTEIPINVSIYQKTNKLLTNNEFFYNQDVFYKNSLKCQNPTECFNHYLEKIVDIDFIIINSNPPIIDLFPIAKELNIKMQNYLKTNSDFIVFRKIKSTYYGDVIIYRRKKNQMIKSYI